MEDEIQPVAAPEADDLQQQVLWLRKQIFTILVLTIVISGTLNVYLWRLGKQRNAELNVVKPQVAPMINQYQVVAPRMDEFQRRIIEYGRTHPDFAPIMMKYQLGPAPGTSTPPPPGTSPAPPVTAPAPK